VEHRQPATAVTFLFALVCLLPISPVGLPSALALELRGRVQKLLLLLVPHVNRAAAILASRQHLAPRVVRCLLLEETRAKGLAVLLALLLVVVRPEEVQISKQVLALMADQC
jgi:hypothetical protein